MSWQEVQAFTEAPHKVTGEMLGRWSVEMRRLEAEIAALKARVPVAQTIYHTTLGGWT